MSQERHPLDYEPCGECGYDHSYEPEEATKAHASMPSPSWGDVQDEWSKEIEAAFPTRSGSHKEYAMAMKMVGNRRSKSSLVALVNWLLLRAEGKA